MTRVYQLRGHRPDCDRSQKRLPRQRWLRRFSCSAIVNCSGLGSIDLSGEELQPLRGVLVHARNRGLVNGAHCLPFDEGIDGQNVIFIVLRGKDRLVLGGLVELGELEHQPGTAIVHNTGYGGSRFTFSWGLTSLAAQVQQIYLTSAMASGWFRTIDRITDMLPGLDLVKPGMVSLAEWWPDGPRTSPLTPIQHLLVGALAYKP